MQQSDHKIMFFPFIVQTTKETDKKTVREDGIEHRGVQSQDIMVHKNLQEMQHGFN